MAQNEARLQLQAMACNLGVFLQGTDLPEAIADCSLTRMQTRLIKIGARIEVAISGDLFIRILTVIQRLRAPPVPQ